MTIATLGWAGSLPYIHGLCVWSTLCKPASELAPGLSSFSVTSITFMAQGQKRGSEALGFA